MIARPREPNPIKEQHPATATYRRNRNVLVIPQLPELLRTRARPSEPAGARRAVPKDTADGTVLDGLITCLRSETATLGLTAFSAQPSTALPAVVAGRSVVVTVRPVARKPQACARTRDIRWSIKFPPSLSRCGPSPLICPHHPLDRSRSARCSRRRGSHRS